jgi:hypothetical protein
MSGADRQRRWYARQREGRVCAKIELGRDQVDELVDRGFLAEWDDDNLEAIGAAAEKALALNLTRYEDADAGGVMISKTGKRDHESSASLLRELGRLIDTTDARRVWAELESYRTNDWRQGRLAGVCPHADKTLDAICWHILKRNSQPPNIETVEEALALWLKL